MKTAKGALIVALFLALVGGAFYLPASRHMVVYDGKSHIVGKAQLGWDNTYLNLDKEPLQWKVVLQSPTLREYFLKHYKDVVLAKLKKESGSLWDKFKSKAKQTLKGAAQQSKEWLKREAPKHLKTLKEQAKKGLEIAKEKGKELLEKKSAP